MHTGPMRGRHYFYDGTPAASGRHMRAAQEENMRGLVFLAALLAASVSPGSAQNVLPQGTDPYFKAARSALKERLSVTPNTGNAQRT